LEIIATPEDFLTWIGEALRVRDYETEDRTHIFRLRTRPDPRSRGIETLECQLSQSKLEKVIESLSDKEEREETVLFQPTYYEVLVSDRSSSLGVPLFDPFEELTQADTDNGITYTLTRPSDEYLLFLMYKVASMS
jgi:hypothetical protein